MLDDEQPRRGDLDDEAQRRDGAERAPNPQFLPVGPDAEMNARRSTAGATLTSAPGTSGSGRSNSSGCATADGGSSASEILGM